MVSEMRIAVLFDNFGPYHIARLTRLSGCCDVLGLEVAEHSFEYAWMPTGGMHGFRREVLLKGSTSAKADLHTVSEALDKVLSDFSPDVVAVPGWSTDVACEARRWCGRRRVPVVLMSESQAADHRRYLLKEWVKRWYVSTCQAALAGGRRHKEYLVALGMDEDRVFLGYDAVDNDYFESQTQGVRERAQETLASLGLPERFFLASSRFIPKKNLLVLIRAFERYRTLCESESEQIRTEKPWTLVLLGDGALRGEIEAEVNRYGLGDHVQLPGFTQYEDLPAYYALASAFVHASTTEQWGLVINEAMASSLAVLVSNRCGCTADLVEEGRNGYTFDPCDVEALAQYMLRLWRDPEQTRQMGLEGKRIIANWGTDAFARGMMAAAKRAMSCEVRRDRILDRLADWVLVRP